MSTLVNGHVLVAFRADWSQTVELSLKWQTEITGAKRGHEDRAALRASPRASMTWLLSARNVVESARMEDAVRAALKSGLAAVPFHAGPSYPSGLGSGGSVLGLESPSRWKWATGDYLLVVRDDGSWTVRQATFVNVGLLQLALDTPLVAGDIAGRSRIFPILFGRLETDSIKLASGPDLLRLPCRLITPTWRVGGLSAAPETYLGHAVAPLPVVNWGETVTRALLYDQDVQQIGFGQEINDPEQSYVTETLEAILWLDGATPIADAEAFVGSLDGRRSAFWIPAQERAMLVSSGVSTTAFKIVDQGLRDSYLDQPDLYLRFKHATLGTMTGKMQTVASAGAGFEQVTMTAALPHAVDASWDVFRLRLVRMADDELRESYDADSVATMRLRTVEVPLEYAPAGSGVTPGAVGSRPAFLYRFKAQFDDAVFWTFTSHDEAIVFGGDTYAPTSISHQDVNRSARNEREEITLTSFMEDGNPLALFLPFPPSTRLKVTVRRVDLAGDPSVATVVFEGFLGKVKFTGRTLKATVSSPIDYMDRKVPGAIIGRLCNAQLYGYGCYVVKSAYAVAGVIDGLNGAHLTLAADPGKPHNWFAAGYVVIGSGQDKEIRSVVASTAGSILMSYPLFNAAVGDVVTLYPGCSHLPADCTGKFNNFANFQGHPKIPEVNPTLKGIPTPAAAQGGK